MFSLPVGFSIAGCAGTNPNNYCNNTGHRLRLSRPTRSPLITLPGNTTGVSLAFGQTGQLGSPAATNCKGGTESVTTYAYGSTNLNLVDVTPNGGAPLRRNLEPATAPAAFPTSPSALHPLQAAIAAGCTGPLSAPTCLVQMTASGDGVTSNTVPIWVHPALTNLQLSVASPTTGVSGFQGCFSQNQTSQLDAIASVAGPPAANGTPTNNGLARLPNTPAFPPASPTAP